MSAYSCFRYITAAHYSCFQTCRTRSTRAIVKLHRSGHKRLDKRRRGPTKKRVAMTDMNLDVVINGGLDFSKWDDSVIAAAIVFGFFKLRRSGEFLRKNAHPNSDKCARVGDCRLANDGGEAWHRHQRKQLGRTGLSRCSGNRSLTKRGEASPPTRL